MGVCFMSFSTTFVMMFFPFFLLFVSPLLYVKKKNSEQNLGVRKK